MKRSLFYLLLIFAITVLFAQVPRTMSFMGQITYDDGTPMVGIYDVTVLIYDSETGGTPLWSETHSTFADTMGGIHLNLGSVNPLDLTFDRQYWVAIVVAGDTMATRLPLAASPYSLSSVNTVNGVSPDNTGNITFTGSDVSFLPGTEEGNVVIGLPPFMQTLNGVSPDEFGNLDFADGDGISWDIDSETGLPRANYSGPGGHRSTYGNSETNGAITVQTTSELPVVKLEATPGPSQGMKIEAAKADSALLTVINSHASAESYGIYAGVTSSNENSVAILAEAARGTAIYAASNPNVPMMATIIAENTGIGTSNFGIYGGASSAGDSSAGVYGVNSAPTGLTYGVKGVNSSNNINSAAVYGINPMSTGEYSNGVRGEIVGGSASIENVSSGVMGLARDVPTDRYAYGVYGKNTGESTESGGVFGVSTNGYGVIGSTQGNEAFSAGVYGIAEGDGRATAIVGENISNADSSMAIYGVQASPTGQVYAVVGEIASTNRNAAAILGINSNSSATEATGVLGIVKGGSPGTTEVIPAGIRGIAHTNSTSGGFGVVGLTEGAECYDGGGVYGKSKGFGVVGETSSETADFAGVYGISSGNSPAVLGEVASESDSNSGVVGLSYAVTSLSYGVQGYSMSTNAQSAGVFGLSEDANGVIGKTVSNTTDMAGVLGIAEAGLTYGVMGTNKSPVDYSAAIYGSHSDSSHYSMGVIGETRSPNGIGVYGVGNGRTGDCVGVAGESGSPTGIGVYGGGAYGLIGEGDSCGVYAATISAAGKAISTLGGVAINRLDETPVALFDVSTGSFVFNGASGSPITTFGGPTNRVAIQTINNSATPTIGNNNFAIVAEAPLVLTTSAHGVTVSCPECCTEPCGGGGDTPCITCDGETVTTGGGGYNGELVVYDSGGGYMHTLDFWGASSTTGGSFDGDVHIGGSLFATHKSFVEPHPEIEGKDIAFSCTESDLVMVEHAGIVNLEDGYGEYELPHEFVLLVEEGTYSVMCTPQSIERPAQIGAEVTQDGTVRIRNFTGDDIPVAFNVKAIRKGYKDHPVVIDHFISPIERRNASR